MGVVLGVRVFVEQALFGASPSAERNEQQESDRDFTSAARLQREATGDKGYFYGESFHTREPLFVG